jgi:hypothetical protein
VVLIKERFELVRWSCQAKTAGLALGIPTVQLLEFISTPTAHHGSKIGQKSLGLNYSLKLH